MTAPSVVRGAQRGAVGGSAVGEPARADVDDLEHPREIARGLRRPRAIPADLGFGIRWSEVPILHHEVDGLIEGHLLRVQRGVHHDAGGAEERRLVLEQQVSRVGEEPLLAHDALGVETPAFGEVRGEVRAADVRAVLLRHDEMPVMTRIRLVYGRRWYTGAAVALEALLHLFRWRAVRRVRHEEVAVKRIAERGRLVVARDRLDRPLIVRRRLDRASLAPRERGEAGIPGGPSRALSPFLVLRAPRGRRGARP